MLELQVQRAAHFDATLVIACGCWGGISSSTYLYFQELHISSDQNLDITDYIGCPPVDIWSNHKEVHVLS